MRKLTPSRVSRLSLFSHLKFNEHLVQEPWDYFENTKASKMIAKDLSRRIKCGIRESPQAESSNRCCAPKRALRQRDALGSPTERKRGKRPGHSPRGGRTCTCDV